MEPIQFPDMRSETLIEHSIDELGTWVEGKLEAGMSAVTLIGLMELYKTSLAYNLLEDEDEDD